MSVDLRWCGEVVVTLPSLTNPWIYGEKAVAVFVTHCCCLILHVGALSIFPHLPPKSLDGCTSSRRLGVISSDCLVNFVGIWGHHGMNCSRSRGGKR